MLISPIGTSTIYTNGEGLDLHFDPPNQFAISDAHLALIYGAVQEVLRNAPNGFAGLDNLSTVNAAVRVQYIDSATVDGWVPRSGELIVTSDTKELRYGDSTKIGGYRAGLNSKSQIYVGADGTPAENGVAYAAAYARAKVANPNGAAKSAANKMYVILGAGVWDASSLLIMDVPFIETIGIGGNPDSVRLNLSGTSIVEACYDFGWRNFTFYKSGVTHNVQWRFNDQNPVNINWENLRIEGLSTENFLSTYSRTSGAISTFNGTVKNVKTATQKLMSGAVGITSHTINIIFDDCQAGNNFIGVTPVGNRAIFAGTMRNCVWTNTTLCSFDMTATTVLHNTKFGMPLNYCATGARITYCRFVPVAGVYSLKSAVASQTPYIAHCELSATGIDATNITNAAGVSAYNVLSDN